MKKKMLVLLIILCLSLALIACGEKESEEPAANESSLELEASEEEGEAAKEMEAEEESAEDAKGIDVVKSLGTSRPKTLKMVSEITAANIKTTMTSYYDGDKSKTEIDIANMPKSILIHLPDEGIMYQYVYGESSGVKITGADKEGAEEMGLMVDTDMLTALTDGASDDITARTEDLDGEKVIYIESTEADEDMGEMLVKMWYSERYATPLKYEVYVGEKLMTELRVTEINDNVNFNADTFMPPSDIVFQEIDMETMMNMY